MANKVSIKLPEVDMKNITPKIMILALIVMAFVIGMLYQKVQNLQGGVTTPSANTNPAAQPAQAALTVDDLKKYAQKIGLDTNKFNSCLDSGKYADAISKEENYGTSLGVTGTPGFLLNGHLISGAMPYQNFKDAIDFELSGGNWNTPPASLGTIVGKTKSAVDIGDSPSIGNKNAKVVLVEFSDFQCPYCGIFYQQSEAQLKKEYVDTGKVLFVYKNYPLYSLHPFAEKAAEAGACANEQGKFWEMHDAMFNSHPLGA